MRELESARELVWRSGARPLGRLLSRGYAWVWSRYVPAVERLARGRSRRDRVLAADGYYDIGDIHDINNAPRAAARAYRKSLNLDPTLAASWRELGNMLQHVGDYRGAVRALRKAVRLDPEDEWAIMDLEYSKGELAAPTKPLYHDGAIGSEAAPAWDVHELLAQRRPERALQLLERKRSLAMRQLRARVYGALGDTERQLQEWEIIPRCRGWVELNYEDWFFLTPASWNSPRFWRALNALGERFVGIGGREQDGLFRAIPEPAKKIRGSQAERSRYDRRRRLIVRYHIARTERDHAKAEKLAHRYPKWTEAQRLVRTLSR